MSGVQALSHMPLLRFACSESCISRRSSLWVQPVVLCRLAVVSSSAGHVTSRRNRCQAARVSAPKKCQPLQASFASFHNLGLMPKRHSFAAPAASSDKAAGQAANETRPSNMYIAVSVLVLVGVHLCKQADCNIVWLAAVEHLGSCSVWSSKQSFVQDGSRSLGELCILPGSAANLWLCCCLFWRTVLAIQASKTCSTQTLATRSATSMHAFNSSYA